jgi:hypothetical protein
MPAAKCHLGQDYTVAFAGTPVVLRPVSGSFGSGGTVSLIAKNGDDCHMTAPQETWTRGQVTAILPKGAPGNRSDGQPFKILIAVTNGDTFVAEDVYVTGPAEDNWPDPPMHMFQPAGGTVQPYLVPQPAPEGADEGRRRRRRRTRV